MVDVSEKTISVRRATAAGQVRTTPVVIDLLRRDALPKGDALAVARVAGIMGAKRTPDLVPLCHPIALHGVDVELTLTESAVTIEVTGEPAAMGYCHCRSCRSWSGGPVNAFSLWRPQAVRITAGREHVATFQKSELSQRQYFTKCGGCHYQHAAYEHQLEIKSGILKENLLRIARLELKTELVIHPSPPWNYRNRSRLQVKSSPAFAAGYFRMTSHELQAVEECPISSPLINRGIAALWQSGRAGKVPAGIGEVEFFANADDTRLLLDVACKPETRRAAVLDNPRRQGAEGDPRFVHRAG